MARTIVFMQGKGGAGKSTLLTQLAGHWLARGRRVAIVDTDPQGTALAWAGLRAAEPGRARPDPVIASAGWRAASDLREAAAKADLVLMDTAGRADALTGTICDRADLVLVPCQPAMPDVLATRATLETLRGGRAPVLVVLNRVPVRSRAAVSAEAALRALGAPVATARLGQRSAYAESFARGLSATESGSGVAAEEIAALAAEVGALLGG